MTLAENELWFQLTGVLKAKSDLGTYPFQLLCSIAKARAEGITSANLARETKQDARSITARLNLLIKSGLIRKYPIISNGSWTYVSVYKKFTWVHRDVDQNTQKPGSTIRKETPASSVPLDKSLIRRKVVESVKHAANHIRFYMDMVEEFKVKRVRLGSIVRRLSAQGYIEQMVVYREDTPHRMFICVKYLKDLPLSDDPDEEDEEEEDEEDEDEDEDNGFGENDSGENIDPPDEEISHPSDISLMQQRNLADSATNSKHSFLGTHKYNIIYTLQTQIHYMINASGVTGASGGGILNEFSGKCYFRIITRELDQLAGNLSPKDLENYTNSPLGHLIVIRGIDFSARIKYYRYFSNPGYASLNNIPYNSLWGKYFQPDAEFADLIKMEKARYKPLPGRANIVPRTDGQTEAVFYGSFGVARKREPGVKIPVVAATPSKSGKKRGRPRKSDIGTPSKKHKPDDPETIVPSNTDEIQNDTQVPKPSNDIQVPEISNTISGGESEIQETVCLSPSTAPSLKETTNKPSPQPEIPRPQSQTSNQTSLDSFFLRTATTSSSSVLTPEVQPQKDDTLPEAQKTVLLSNTADSLLVVDPLLQEAQDKHMSHEAKTPDNEPQTQKNTVLPEELPTATNHSLMDNTTPKKQENAKDIINPGTSVSENPPSLDSESNETSYLNNKNSNGSEVSKIPNNLSDIDKGTPSKLTDNPKSAGEASVPVTPSSGTPTTSFSVPSTAKILTKQRPRTSAFAFAGDKRNRQILETLDSLGGVYENGVSFLRVFNNQFKNENGAHMDKKTLDKVVSAMCKTGEVRLIFVAFPFRCKNGSVIPVKKSLILRSEIPDSDPKITRAKAEARKNLENPKKKPPHTIVRKKEETTFEMVTEKYKDLVRRSNRHYLIKTGQAPRNKAKDRLGKIDAALRNKKKLMSKQKKKERKKGKEKEKGNDSGEKRARKRTKLSTDEIPKNSAKKSKSTKKNSSVSNNDININIPEDPLTPITRRRQQKKSRDAKENDPNSNGFLLLDKYTATKSLVKTFKKSRARVRHPGILDGVESLGSGGNSKKENKAIPERSRNIRTIDDIDIFIRVVIIYKSFLEVTYKIYWDDLTEELKYWFPKTTAAEVKRLWARCRGKLGGAVAVDRLVSSWKTIFEQGYESGKIKLMDPDDLDYVALAKFWKKKSPHVMDSKVVTPMLLKSRDEFERKYIIVPNTYTSNHGATVEGDKPMTGLRDSLGGWSMAKPRIQFASQTQVSSSANEAKISVKAIIATPERLYDENAARDMLLEYNESDVNKAIESLDKEHSIVYVARDFEKVRPGRNFMFSEKFLLKIALNADANNLSSASSFYESLVSSLDADSSFKLPASIRDSEMLCILDLIRTNQLNLECVKKTLRVENPDMNDSAANTSNEDITSSLSRKRKLGEIRNRRVDRSKHDCDIFLRTSIPQTSFPLDPDPANNDETISSLVQIDRPHVPFPLGHRGKYIWVGVTGMISSPIFERLVTWIIMHLTDRPGITPQILFSDLEPVLELEEINALLKWLKDRGIVGPTTHNGIKLLPGWYYNVFN